MVSISSVKGDNYDQACILQAGDHLFITHKSYVAYSLCRIETSSDITSGVDKGYFTDKGMLDNLVFQRIITGLFQSRFTKPFANKFL